MSKSIEYEDVVEGDNLFRIYHPIILNYPSAFEYVYGINAHASYRVNPPVCTFATSGWIETHLNVITKGESYLCLWAILVGL